jgi:predicted Rossmann fold nucleotide-binding protein DprA/Smf involved in DNA uptake
VEDKMAAL